MQDAPIATTDGLAEETDTPPPATPLGSTLSGPDGATIELLAKGDDAPVQYTGR